MKDIEKNSLFIDTEKLDEEKKLIKQLRIQTGVMIFMFLVIFIAAVFIVIKINGVYNDIHNMEQTIVKMGAVVDDIETGIEQIDVNSLNESINNFEEISDDMSEIINKFNDASSVLENIKDMFSFDFLKKN